MHGVSLKDTCYVTGICVFFIWGWGLTRAGDHRVSLNWHPRAATAAQGRPALTSLHASHFIPGTSDHVPHSVVTVDHTNTLHHHHGTRLAEPKPQRWWGGLLASVASMVVMVLWAAKQWWKWKEVKVFPGNNSVTQYDIIMLSLAGQRNEENSHILSSEDLFSKVQHAFRSGRVPSLDVVWQVSGQSSVMGMTGRCTLTWQPQSACAKLEIDCTSCLPLGSTALRRITAVVMALPGTSPSNPSPTRDGTNAATTGTSSQLGEGTSALTRLDHQSICWEQDWSGLTCELELEDAESTAIGHWLWTGQWLDLHAAGVLLSTPLDCTSCQRLADSLLDDVKEASYCGMALQICGGRVVTNVLIDSTTWRPVLAAVQLPDGAATWHFSDWIENDFGHLPCLVTYTLPGCLPIVHTLHPGSIQTLTADSAWLQCPVPLTGSLMGQRYSSPDVFARSSNPLGAWYDDACGAPTSLPVWQGEGGHLFCQPTVGGYDLGLFIIDTATDCLVIDPDVLPADLNAKCERFAVHTVPGLGGTPRRTALVRGLGPLILGPLMLERPLFREACLTGVVRPPTTAGPNPRIAGILGYDFLRHCRLEIGIRGGAPWMRIRRPGGLAPPRQALGWQQARFLRRVPHIQVSLHPLDAPASNGSGNLSDGASMGMKEIDANPAASQRGLFRLALGTGGASIILGTSISHRLGLFNSKAATLFPSGTVSAPASSDQLMARLRVLQDGTRIVPINQVAFPGTAFNNVLALCHAEGDPDDLYLSCYADGLLGVLLFRDSVLLLDYSSRRISITPALGP